jgi:hypothetical protein
MSHLITHQNRYPVGMVFGKRTIVENSIHTNFGYRIRVRCVCGNIAVIRPRDFRPSCRGCKKFEDTEAIHAKQFKLLLTPRDKLTPVDVVLGIPGAPTSYGVVYYCACRPRTKYIMAFNRWHNRVHTHCHHCAETYIPECVRYKGDK